MLNVSFVQCFSWLEWLIVMGFGLLLRIVFIFPDGVKHTIFMKRPIDCITSMTRIPIPNIVENFRYFFYVWIESGESPAWKDSNLFFWRGRISESRKAQENIHFTSSTDFAIFTMFSKHKRLSKQCLLNLYLNIYFS